MSNISTPNSNLFVICATNCPWDLDPAFLRRFERRIYIPLPKREERFEVLQYYMQNTPLMNAFNNWEPLLTQTEGFSFSEVADLVSQAFLVSLIKIINLGCTSNFSCLTTYYIIGISIEDGASIQK